ncbi:MAG: TIM barrel protein [Phycisphaeraceae bacterium]
MLTRRNFLAGSLAFAAAPLVPALGIGPIKRSGKQILKLSLAAYSLRKFFPLKPGEPGAIDMPGFLDYCASLGLDGAELTSYFFPKEITAAYLNELKRKAHIHGLDISGGAIGNNFTIDPGPKLDDQMKLTKMWVDHYAAMGAPVIRVFAGNPPKGVSEEEAIKRAIPVLEEACEYAGTKGVMLGIENHDFTTKADRLMQIIDAVKSPWFGVNFDSGNFHSADPYADMAKIAPYAINAQIKVEIKPEGKPKEPSDLPRVMKILKDGGYSGYIVLEYEAAEDPYKAVPGYLEQLRKLL